MPPRRLRSHRLKKLSAIALFTFFAGRGGDSLHAHVYLPNAVWLRWVIDTDHGVGLDVRVTRTAKSRQIATAGSKGKMDGAPGGPVDFCIDGARGTLGDSREIGSTVSLCLLPFPVRLSSLVGLSGFIGFIGLINRRPVLSESFVQRKCLFRKLRVSRYPAYLLSALNHYSFGVDAAGILNQYDSCSLKSFTASSTQCQRMTDMIASIVDTIRITPISNLT